ncbi:MAG: GDP-L-fucose synthetase [Robiginitomaculum sp.]|nr:MAG: GDP-L-fucose synthetase [Robiginitomaculum sp.]
MIVVTGATGFLGKRTCKALESQNIPFVKASKSLGVDLENLDETIAFFKEAGASKILNCASFVGGIQFGMKYPADIFRHNMALISTLFEAAHQCGIQRIVNPISNCVYPARATLFKEEEIWDGPLHESVMVYGLLRKLSWAGAWAYNKQHGLETVNLILSNMYGPEDHFEEERSHALGALVMKFVEAKINNSPEVVIWGTGTPVREWLYVDDGAEAMVRGLTCTATNQPINVGVADGISILELAEKIKTAVGYKGKLVLDTSKPDGAAFKTVDGQKGKKLLKWTPEISLNKGIQETVDWYSNNRHDFTK